MECRNPLLAFTIIDDDRILLFDVFHYFSMDSRFFNRGAANTQLTRLNFYSQAFFFYHTNRPIITDSLNPNEDSMPRCFMAKKLKYPYEQWKQEQEQRSPGSRSPSPLAMDTSEDLERSNELAKASSGQLVPSK